jgi:hypothetical protein
MLDPDTEALDSVRADIAALIHRRGEGASTAQKVMPRQQSGIRDQLLAAPLADWPDIVDAWSENNHRRLSLTEAKHERARQRLVHGMRDWVRSVMQLAPRQSTPHMLDALNYMIERDQEFRAMVQPPANDQPKPASTAPPLE